MWKSKGKSCMVEEPSHVKQLSLNHVCKIGLKEPKREILDRSDFPDFYTIKSSWVGDLLIKILTYYFKFWEFLTRMLSRRVRNSCVCSAYASGPDAYAQHAHQFLTHVLSMVCRDLYNERPLEKWKSDAYAEHTHQFLTHMLSMRTSSLRVCSACAPVPDAYAQPTLKGRSINVRKSNFFIIF